MLRWAVERAGLSDVDVRTRFAKYGDWLSGTVHPTFKQLQSFAHATHASIGYFFLSTPPVLGVPIPDFRILGDQRPGEPSPDLLDTIYLCQQRQDWYVGYAKSSGAEPLAFVGSLNLRSAVVEAADAIRGVLGFDVAARQRLSTWEEALRQFIQLADAAGVLVMVSGVVGGNNTRKLNTEEFRGFALSDPIAPLVFVNGADTRSAQMFTLAHELAHLWLGESALSNSTVAEVPAQRVEQWCNRVAAEVLVPLESFRAAYRPGDPIDPEMNRLARRYKVSTLVILRRMHDAGGLTQERFWSVYRAEVVRLLAIMRDRTGGGDYYRTTTSRASHRFIRGIVTSALEGQSTFTEAFRLLGCKKMSTFAELGHHVGINVEGSVA